MCGKCNTRALGDEYHVLFTCENKEIVRLRTKYIPRYYRDRPIHFKYILLMQTSNVNILKNLAVFLKVVLSMFR